MATPVIDGRLEGTTPTAATTSRAAPSGVEPGAAASLVEAAVLDALDEGLDAPGTRVSLDRMLAAFWRRGARVRLRVPTGASAGDLVALALFEAGVREIEIAPKVTYGELVALVEALAAGALGALERGRSVRARPNAPPRVELPHVELRSTPVGEVCDVALRERRLEAARPIEQAALEALRRAPAASRPARRTPVDRLARARDDRDARFARLSVDAAIAEVRAWQGVALPAVDAPLRPRPLSLERLVQVLAARRLDRDLEQAARGVLESTFAATEVEP